MKKTVTLRQHQRVVADLKKALTIANERSEHHRGAAAHLDAEVSRLSRIAVTARRDVGMLQRELNELKVANGEMSEVAARMSESCDREVAAVKAACRAEADDLRNELLEIKKSCTELQLEVAAARQRTNDRVNEVHEEYRLFIQAKDGEIERLQGLSDRMGTDLRVQQGRTSELRDVVTILAREFASHGR